VLDEWRELLTERIGVLLAQVDLVVRTAEAEPHGLIRPAAIKVVFQRDGYSLGHLNLHNRDGACYRTQASVNRYSRNAADQRHVQRNQSPGPEQIFR